MASNEALNLFEFLLAAFDIHFPLFFGPGFLRPITKKGSRQQTLTVKSFEAKMNTIRLIKDG